MKLIYIFCLLICMPALVGYCAPDKESDTYEKSLAAYVDKRILYCRQNAAAGDALPEEIVNILKLAEERQWEQISRIDVELLFEAPPVTEFHVYNRLWHPVNEIYHAAKMYHMWGDKTVGFYLSCILSSLTSNSVVITGTDAGRYVLAPAIESKAEFGSSVVSVNALADDRYVSYIQAMCGRKIAFPSKEERLLDAKTILTDDGNTPLSIKTVSQINEQILKRIYNTNKEQHTFFIDEGFAFPWVYENGENVGVLIRLGKTKQQKFWSRVINRRLWNGIENYLVKTSGTKGARNTFAKLRCAQGGLYKSNGFDKEAEYSFHQAMRISPEYPEGYARLCTEILIPSSKKTEAEQVIQIALSKCGPDGILNAIATDLGKGSKREVEKEKGQSSHLNISTNEEDKAEQKDF